MGQDKNQGLQLGKGGGPNPLWPRESYAYNNDDYRGAVVSHIICEYSISVVYMSENYGLSELTA